MAIRMARSGHYLDDSLQDGYVRTEANERGWLTYYMTPATYRALHKAKGGAAPGEMAKAVRTLPVGLHRLPRYWLESGEIAELRASLEFTERGSSALCRYLVCSQETAAVVDGYGLCATHAEVLRGRGELIA